MYKSGHKANEAKKRTRSRYTLSHRRDKNKILRIAKSNGREAATKYARDHNLFTWARTKGLVGGV